MFDANLSMVSSATLNPDAAPSPIPLALNRVVP